MKNNFSQDCFFNFFIVTMFSQKSFTLHFPVDIFLAHRKFNSKQKIFFFDNVLLYKDYAALLLFFWGFTYPQFLWISL
ncbi:hypothetical protein Lwor_2021 [Legionella worsleiensis]|uniref:Uncharacterized protein n=1 Tax=Legionella worsleiensis TaxID=45076 RepID=A0A0W1A5Z7_9GAMM|nr:hypothetical protein Lwor_2021 [Legionella worsleiensis]STY30633.1 Uncharacterised protein [Legionella worsleiensis]